MADGGLTPEVLAHERRLRPRGPRVSLTDIDEVLRPVALSDQEIIVDALDMLEATAKRNSLYIKLVGTPKVWMDTVERIVDPEWVGANEISDSFEPKVGATFVLYKLEETVYLYRYVITSRGDDGRWHAHFDGAKLVGRLPEEP